MEIIKIDNSIIVHISSQHSANYLHEGNYHIINKYTDNMKRMIFWDKGYFVEVKSSIHLQTWKFHSKSGKMRNKADKIKNGNGTLSIGHWNAGSKHWNRKKDDIELLLSEKKI